MLELTYMELNHFSFPNPGIIQAFPPSDSSTVKINLYKYQVTTTQSYPTTRKEQVTLYLIRTQCFAFGYTSKLYRAKGRLRCPLIFIPPTHPSVNVSHSHHDLFSRLHFIVCYQNLWLLRGKDLKVHQYTSTDALFWNSHTKVSPSVTLRDSLYLNL